MADFYIDNDVTISLATELRSWGHSARTTRDLGLQQASDAQLLALAAQNRWILVPHNRRDFALLHDAWLRWTGIWQVSERHAGILLFPHGQPARDMARTIDRFLQGMPQMLNRLYEWRAGHGATQL